MQYQSRVIPVSQNSLSVILISYTAQLHKTGTASEWLWKCIAGGESMRGNPENYTITSKPLCLGLGLLGAVLGARRRAARDTGQVERTTDDLVTGG